MCSVYILILDKSKVKNYIRYLLIESINYISEKIFEFRIIHIILHTVQIMESQIFQKKCTNILSLAMTMRTKYLAQIENRIATCWKVPYFQIKNYQISSQDGHPYRSRGSTTSKKISEPSIMDNFEHVG